VPFSRTSRKASFSLGSGDLRGSSIPSWRGANCGHEQRIFADGPGPVSEFIERVQKHHERVVVTRNGTPAAVLVSPEDLESLEETLAVLEDSEAIAELVEAHRALLEDDVLRGVEAVKALRPR
jgi:antitoxin YefM